MRFALIATSYSLSLGSAAARVLWPNYYLSATFTAVLALAFAVWIVVSALVIWRYGRNGVWVLLAAPFAIWAGVPAVITLRCYILTDCAF